MIPRNAGVVINISSASSYHHMRYWSIYSATKKFISHFTHILSKEFNNTGIVFQVVCPFIVDTKNLKTKASRFPSTSLLSFFSSFFVPESRTFVKQALCSVGHITKTTGYLAHEIQAYTLALPELMADFIVDKISLMIRKRAIRRNQRVAAKKDSS
uniref:Uncharacterized protein n=1 Tax=Acrobeloides nanus TaxID=290746 RepID=A0A914CP49_9BILA